MSVRQKRRPARSSPVPAHRSTRIADARRYAQLRHRGATGRDGVSPYFDHVSAVAKLLADAGGSEALLCAAYLHDVVEDTAATIPELAARFGADVADIVHQVTNHPHDDHGQTRTWFDQKHATIATLTTAPPAVVWLKAADLCANADEVLRNYAHTGPQTWSHYDARPNHQLGYYLTLGHTLLSRLDNTILTNHVTTRITALTTLAHTEGIKPAFPALA
jgi:(p)ppGpp synthase/HD superfamily hydrolase